MSGCKKNCGCNSSLDAWEYSRLKGLTEYDREEWFDRLNDLINNGAVLPIGDTSSLIGSSVIGTMVIGSN